VKNYAPNGPLWAALHPRGNQAWKSEMPCPRHGEKSDDYDLWCMKQGLTWGSTLYFDEIQPPAKQPGAAGFLMKTAIGGGDEPVPAAHLSEAGLYDAAGQGPQEPFIMPTRRARCSRANVIRLDPDGSRDAAPTRSAARVQPGEAYAMCNIMVQSRICFMITPLPTCLAQYYT